MDDSAKIRKPRHMESDEFRRLRLLLGFSFNVLNVSPDLLEVSIPGQTAASPAEFFRPLPSEPSEDL